MDKPESIEKRFIFSADAVAFAAHIRRPTDFQFKAVASSCLPVTGGLAEASSGEQSHGDLIYFKSASTSALGDFADTRRAVDFTHGNFGENELSTQTFVDARLKGLNIQMTQDHPPSAAGKVVTFRAEEFHARLESFSDRRGQNAFRGLEAEIKGVTVDGYELIVTTVSDVCTKHETYDKLVASYRDDGDFRKKYGELFYPTGHEQAGLSALLHKPSIPNAGGIILGTVVTSLKWAKDPAPGTEIRRNRLIVEGLGSFFFGEILYEHSGRRLTLLRFQLGCPSGGEGAVCDVEAKGHLWPPA